MSSLPATFRKIAIVGGAVTVLGGIGFIIYAIVWALNSKIGKSLAPFLGFVNSILASLAAHPVEWIALIGLGIAAVIAAPIIYQIAKYIRERQVLKKSMQKANEESADTTKKPFTEEAIDDIDVLSSRTDFARADVVKQARVLQKLDTLSSEDRGNLQHSERLLEERRVYSRLMEDKYNEARNAEEKTEAKGAWDDALRSEGNQVGASSELHLALFDKYVAK